MDTLLISQGELALVSLDTYVTNGVTSSCALVVVFIENCPKVVCYHWPAFDIDNLDYLNTIKSYCRNDATVTNLIVITNGFAYEKEKEKEKQTQIDKVNRLKKELNSEDAHYYAYCKVNGTPGIAIMNDGNYKMLDSFIEINLKKLSI